MANGYPLLSELWNGGAISVETPMNLSIPPASIVPDITPLAHRTVVQWDGDTIHRYSRLATKEHQQAHVMALEAKFLALNREVAGSFGRLTWLKRGLQVSRVGLVCGSVAVGSTQMGIEALHHYADAVLIPGLTSAGIGFASEIGLRIARSQIRKRIRGWFSDTWQS